MISVSDPDRRDAFYGAGVYFTTVPPECSTSEILGNNWDGVRGKTEFVQWFVAIRKSDLPKLKKVGGLTMRDVWVTPDPVYLDEVEHRISMRQL